MRLVPDTINNFGLTPDRLAEFLKPKLIPSRSARRRPFRSRRIIGRALLLETPGTHRFVEVVGHWLAALQLRTVAQVFHAAGTTELLAPSGVSPQNDQTM